MTSRLSVLAAVVLLATACGDTRPPVEPSPNPSPPITPPPVGSLAVTGVVYEIIGAGRRPLADVAIDISLEYQSWPATTRTDADGRYRQIVSRGPHPLKLIAEKPGYSQPCRVPIADTNVDQDVYLVSNDTLSNVGVPSSMPIVQPTLTGLVFERTPQGMQPIAGAHVVLDFTGGMGWAPSATTNTDAAGRYLLCNVVDSTGLGWYALVSKPGYGNLYVPVIRASTGSFDVELQRLQ
jgi:hypothetical protein